MAALAVELILIATLLLLAVLAYATRRELRRDRWTR